MVARASGPDGGTMTVRPGYLRLTVVIPVVIVGGLAIAIGVAQLTAHQPGQAVAGFAAPVVLCVLLRVATRSIRLEITQSVVRARQGRWRGHPDLEVPRNDVRAIHYFPRKISFRGPDNKPFMGIDPNYTLRQMKTVAALLGVPLYDHMRWRGLREVNMGRLVYDPAAADRVS